MFLPPIIPKTTITITPRFSAERIQSVLDAADGKDVILQFKPGAYLLDRGLRFPGVATVVCHNCTIETILADFQDPHSVRSGGTVIGGVWRTKWSGSQYSGIWGCVWRIGKYFTSGEDAHGWTLQDMCVDTNAPWPQEKPYYGRGGNAIFVTGGCSDWRLQDIRTPPYVAACQTIAVHWGGTDKQLLHPSGRIQRLRVGRMAGTHTETSPVSVSAVDHVVIEDVECLECRSGLVAYPGDYGYRADNAVARLVTLRDYIVRRATFCDVLGGKTKAGEDDSTIYEVSGLRINASKSNFAGFRR